MELSKTCETCGRFTAHVKKVLGKDGLCILIVKNPQAVKKSHSCKYWIDKRLLKGDTEK